MLRGTYQARSDHIRINITHGIPRMYKTLSFLTTLLYKATWYFLWIQHIEITGNRTFPRFKRSWWVTEESQSFKSRFLGKTMLAPHNSFRNTKFWFKNMENWDSLFWNKGLHKPITESGTGGLGWLHLYQSSRVLWWLLFSSQQVSASSVCTYFIFSL